MQTIKQSILTIIICLAVVAGVSLVYSAPPGTPPECPIGYPGCDAPINVSTATQKLLGSKILDVTNIDDSLLFKGAFGVGGVFRASSTAIFDGNVGIGTNAPSSKLSILGSIGLLRDPSTATKPGPGPEIFLQSPTNSVSSVNTGWVNCGIGFSSLCPSETVPIRDIYSEYVCQSTDGGYTYVDVRKVGTPPNDYYQHTSVTCIAGTDKYSIRTNAGTLEFLNSAGSSKLTIGQDGAINANNFNIAANGNVGIGAGSTSGSDVTSQSFVIYNGSFQSANPPSSAFDNETSGGMSASSADGVYIGQDFGTGKNIRKVRIYGTTYSYGFSAKLQYSDNGSSWIDTNAYDINIPANSGWKEFLINDYEAHRFWRFLDTRSYQFFQANEIEMIDVNVTNFTMNITSSGNVGIGTASPGAKLDVAGQIKITGGSPGSGKLLVSDAHGLASWQSPPPAPSGWTGSVQLSTGWLHVNNGIVTDYVFIGY